MPAQVDSKPRAALRLSLLTVWLLRDKWVWHSELMAMHIKGALDANAGKP